MCPVEVLALVIDLKESLEEPHKKVETSSAAERGQSRRKSEKHVKTNFKVGDYVLVGKHSLERKPRLLLAGFDHSESWQLSLSGCTQLIIFRQRRDKKSMTAPCASITTHP
jgi:hypothetical protein